MEGEESKLTVLFSPSAIMDLDEIWEWNARHYGIDRAERYASLLLNETAKLATASYIGNSVPAAPRFNYLVIRRKRKGHGHLAVYERVGDVIHVLRYYHTAQDWQRRFFDEKR